jgi:predicted acetyltransferase
MAGVEVRGIDDDELSEFIRAEAPAWGHRVTDVGIDQQRAILEPDRVTVCVDDGRFVGGAAILTRKLTVPGERQLPMAAVTWVFVHPTHRRQGLMRRLLVGQLEGLRDGGEPIAALGASQSQLYRRFGYGVGSFVAFVEIDTAHRAWAVPVVATGRLEMAEAGVALGLVPDLYDRIRRVRNGMRDRHAGEWAAHYRHATDDRGGAGPTFFVLHHSDGELDGFLSYRVAERWSPAGLPEHELRIQELVSAGYDAYVALWRYCLELDLAARVRAGRRPVDEPLSHLLADHRRLRQVVSDDLHVRIVDVPRALAGRAYSCDGAVVLEVADPLCPWVAGRYRLESEAGGSSCAPVGGAPDLRLDAAALGSILLGDVSVEALWRARLVEEVTPGAVRRATAMFTWSPRPWLPDMF